MQLYDKYNNSFTNKQKEKVTDIVLIIPKEYTKLHIIDRIKEH